MAAAEEDVANEDEEKQEVLEVVQAAEAVAEEEAPFCFADLRQCAHTRHVSHNWCRMDGRTDENDHEKERRIKRIISM